ncbi:MAG: hypothetical protein AB1489_35495 [Acidobacteriota bacterium]
MSDPKQRFLCCTRKQIAILRCPRCKQLLGYCQNCATLFSHLLDLSLNVVLAEGSALTCTNCQFSFPTNNQEKYLASQHDMITAGLINLTNEDLILKTGPKEEAPVENYRFNIDKIGWDNNTRRPSTNTTTTKNPSSKRQRMMIVLLIVTILGAGVVFYFQYFDTPKPPPPKPPATKKKR